MLIAQFAQLHRLLGDAVFEGDDLAPRGGPCLPHRGRSLEGSVLVEEGMPESGLARDAPDRGLQVTGDDLEDRRLPGAVAADDSHRSPSAKVTFLEEFRRPRRRCRRWSRRGGSRGNGRSRGRGVGEKYTHRQRTRLPRRRPPRRWGWRSRDRWARSSSRDLPSAPPTSPRSMGRGSRLPARRAGRRLRSSQREGSTTWACESPSTPTSVSTRRRRLSVEMTFSSTKRQGRGPTRRCGRLPHRPQPGCRQARPDRIKGQGFSLQINVATPADVAAAGARIRRRAGRSRMSRVITPGGRGCSSSTIRMGSGSASPPRSRRKARAIAGASRCARWLARLNAVLASAPVLVGAPCRRSAPRAEAPHRHGAVCGAPSRPVAATSDAAAISASSIDISAVRILRFPCS